MCRKRFSTAICVTLLALCATALLADDSKTGAIAELPFQSVFRGIAFVRGQINHGPVMDLLVDTGGASTLVDQKVASELRLATQSAQASASGSSSNIQVGYIPSGLIQVGPIAYRGAIVVTSLSPLEPIFGRALKGIVGGELFRERVVQFDYENNLIRFFQPDYACADCGQTLPITLLEGIPFVEATLSMPNGKSIVGKFLIDTGGNAAIQIWKEVADRQALLAGLPTASDAGRGIGGETPEFSARAKSLKIGDIQIAGPTVAVTDDNSGPKTKGQSVGLIGIDVLRRFTLTFDYKKQKLYARPNRHLSDRFIYDASGLRLRAEPPSFAHVVVSKVISGSPAETARVEKGDALVAIDGRSISGMNLDQIRTLIYQPGLTHRLKIVRAGKNLELVLKTRDMLR
jgi:predicted aspartyl protease